MIGFLPILIIANYRSMASWFIIDDTSNIFCSSFTLVELLFSKDVNRFCNPLFYTPVLPMAFKLDWHFFKLHPVGYHIHNLVAAWVACALLFKLIKKYVDSQFCAWIGVLTFSLSIPVAAGIFWVTRRHYLWGLCFFMGAILLAKESKPNGKPGFVIASAVLSLLAYLSKEIYLFLPVFVMLASPGGLKTRLGKALPGMAMLMAYSIWRYVILGGSGGYPGFFEVTSIGLIKNLLLMPMALSKTIYGISVLPVVLLILSARFGRRSFGTAVVSWLMVSLLFVFFPSGNFSYASKGFVFAGFMALSIAFVLGRMQRTHPRFSDYTILLMVCPIIASTGLRSASAQTALLRLAENYEKLSLEASAYSGKSLIYVGPYAYYFSNLHEIYEKMLKRRSNRLLSVSDENVLRYLDMSAVDVLFINENFGFEPEIAERSTFTRLDKKDIDEYVAKHLSGPLIEAPAVDFWIDRNALEININDTRKGEYIRYLYMGSYVGGYRIPKSYSVPLNRIRPIDKVEIVYVSPTGERSEPRIFDPGKGPVPKHRL